MAMDIALKGVPDTLAEELRRRAEENHRSVEGEIVAILEASVDRERPLTINDLLARVQAMGLSTPSESAAIVRGDRDARGRH